MARIEKVKKLMKEKGYQAMLINNPEDRYYVSDFSGSSGFLLFTPNGNYLVTDFRYVEQAKQQSPQFELKMFERGEHYNLLNNLARKDNVKTLVIDSQAFSYAEYLNFSSIMQMDLQAEPSLLQEMRSIKDETEIEYIAKAQKIAETAFEKMLKKAKVGMTEKELAVELQYQMLLAGSERTSFSSIVVSGVRSALPHGRPTDKVVEARDFVTFDFGAYYKGYCSDMTRTVVFGDYTSRQKEIYDLVLKAQLAAVEAAKPGMTGRELDAVARDIITAGGYGDNFGHGLGHGIGKLVHEAPAVNTRSEDILQLNQVFSIEPGIYIPDWGGVRIEDLIVLTPEGVRNLNSFTKELLVIG